MTVAVVVFPGSNFEQDVVHAVRLLGGDAELVWHKDTDLSGADAVVLPGGFAHGDALRTGAIARFSPIMQAVQTMADSGGARHLQRLSAAKQASFPARSSPTGIWRSRMVDVEVVDTSTILTAAAQVGQRLRIPLNSYEGNWVDPSHRGRVVVRYVDDPNGCQGCGGTGHVAGTAPRTRHRAALGIGRRSCSRVASVPAASHV